MPIRTTTKPLKSYVNGKAFKEAKVRKGAPKEEREEATVERTVEVPHDKAPHDWRDPEAAAVLNDIAKRSTMNSMEKRIKKKEEKTQKDWEEKQAELRGVGKAQQVEEKAEDKKKDKYSFEKVKTSKELKKNEAGKEAGKDAGKDAGKEAPCCDDKAEDKKGDQKPEKKEAAAPAKK